jgi:hypothetical protein
MSRMLSAATVLLLFVAPLAGQEALPPLRIGAHVAGNMMNGPFDMYRVGGEMLIPVGPRWAIYPSVSRFLDGAEWEISAALRYRVSALYAGVGFAGINFGPNHATYDLWLAGLEIPAGRLRPYIELQFLGPAARLLDERHDWGVQLHSGLTWAVR